ncbi:MAG: hypothetical protein KBG15_15015 [Kofleriaceae bacterium]|nr:hypothetical protein [Kofleriaceae bacterium]
MSTNHQLDALLIGALYGELSPAETLTLDAHLLAHPADAGLLAQLRQIHAVVRAGGLTQGFVEPPQAVSALLLQEAARKAPKKSLVSNHNEKPNWLIRLVRSMALHPGLAAAASLALVAGIGGVLFTRGQGAVQDTAPSRSAVLQTGSGSAHPGAGGAAAPSLGSASAETAAVAPPPDVAEGTVTRARADLPKNQFDDAADNELQRAEDDVRRGKPETITADIEDPSRNQPSDGRQPARRPATEGKKLGDPPPPPVASMSKSPKPKDYITVSTSGRQPIEDDEIQAETTNAVSGGRKLDSKPVDRKDANVGAATGGAANGADKDAKKESTPAAKSVAVPTRIVANQSLSSGAASIGPDKVAKTPVQEPAPVAQRPTSSPPSPPNTASADLAWVRGEHEKLKKLVVAGKCTEAAKVGAAMAARAPDYYQQYVATDRQVQACAAYIRERRALESEKTSAGKPTKAVLDSK